MRPILIAAALVASVQSAPAFADKYLAVTPSGAAEMMFGEKPDVVIGKLSSKCIDARWTVISTTSNELVCEPPLNFGQSLVGQMLLGNSYSTPPRRFFRFNVAVVNGISRVQASGWMELQMAFGQTKRTDFAGPEFQNSIFGFMGSAGGKYPVGTTFPNHAALGVDSDGVQLGKYWAFRIKQFLPGSVAQKAGFQIGDVVTGIAGRHFRSSGDYLDATAKAAQTATYPVEIARNGETMTVTVERAFRPAFAEQVAATVETPPSTSVSSPLSVADELEKLARLKQQGVLTEVEFEAQKKKLLGKQ